LLVSLASAQDKDCKVSREEAFSGDGETVRLARKQGLSEAASFAVFKAPLAVNTDGAPTSYHPEDFRGQTRAINRIDNGIAIRRTSGPSLSVAEKVEVFDRWRSGNWQVPSGYRITWQNVIAADEQGNPCVFQQGEYKGYFGSLTAVKNGLSGSAAGECQVKNQLDQRYIPAIVLRGNSNPLRTYGARTEDLVLAMTSTGDVVIPAIIGDTGDGNRIGEGSVALNMALMGKVDQPTTYSEALALDTGTNSMVVAVIPGSRSFQRKRPYSAENISDRLEAWAEANGYGSLDALGGAITACAEGL
jgi:hypothetical protein